MTKQLQQKINSVYSITNIIFLTLQSFMPGFFAFIPLQAHAAETVEIGGVTLEFSKESHKFDLSIETKNDLSYGISYNLTDSQTENKGGVVGVADSNDGLATASQFAGSCSTDGCTKDEFVSGVLDIPVANYSAKFVLVNDILWLESNDKQTVAHVELGTIYSAPQNSDVQVIFTKLPENPGSLSIQKITLSEEQVEQIGAYSNVAYDITSNMENGTFEYELKLPLPEGASQTAGIIYADSLEELSEGKTQSVNNDSVEEGKVVATGLDHFTVFVITDDQATYSAPWIDYATQGYLNTGVHYPTNINAGETATWDFSSLTPGKYVVYVSWSTDPNRTTIAPYDLIHVNGIEHKLINQEKLSDQLTTGASSEWSGWYDYGIYDLNTASKLVLTGVENSSRTDYVIADEVMLVPARSIVFTNTGTPTIGGTNTNIVLEVEATYLPHGVERVRFRYAPQGETCQQQYVFPYYNDLGDGVKSGDLYSVNWDVSGLDSGEYTVCALMHRGSGMGSEGYITENHAEFQVIVDNTGPDAPTIEFPASEQYFNSTPILNNWTDTTDTSGILKYRVKYIYDDGHAFSGAPYRETTVSQRNHTPGTGEQGGVTIWVQAFDNAGNEGAWSEPVHYFYDATAPATPTNLKRLGLDGNEYSCSDYSLRQNMVPMWDANTEGDFDHYEYSSFHANGSQGLDEQVLTTNSLPNTWVAPTDGTYGFAVRAVDKAGNKSHWALTDETWADSCQITYDSTGPNAPEVFGFITPSLSCGAITNIHNTTVDWSDSIDSSVGFHHYEYNIDYPKPDGTRGNWTTTLTSSQYSGSLNEGLHSVRVRAFDVLGNTSAWSNTCNITTDWTDPEISIDSIKYPNSTISTKFITNYNTPVILGSVLSNDAESVVLNVNGHDYPATMNGDKTQWEAIVTDVIPDSDNLITVTVVDIAGNSKSFTKNIFVDTKAPTATHTYFQDGITIINPIAYTQTLGSFTFIGSYEDVLPSSDLYWDSFVIFQAQDDGSFRFAENGKQSYCGWRSTPNLVNLSGSSYSFNTPVPFTDCVASLADGEYYMAHHVYDTATRKDIPSINQFRDVLGLHFIIDTVNPSSTITTFNLPDEGEVETSTFDGLIQGTASDDNSGVAEVTLEIMYTPFDSIESKYWNGSSWQVGSATVTATGADNWSYQISPPEEVFQGIYNITSHAVDKAGNVETTYKITIIYDKTIPEVVLTMDPMNPDGRNSWYVTQPEISLTASDNYSLDHIEYQWNGFTGTWNTYSAVLTPPGEGQNILYYRSIDKVGNISGLGIKDVKYDKTVPTDGAGNLQVKNIKSTTADASWNKPANIGEIDRFVLIWKHSDGSTRSKAVNGNVYETDLYDLFDGEWELTLESQDVAGNAYKVVEKFTVGGGSDGSAVLGVTDEEDGDAGLISTISNFVAGNTKNETRSEENSNSKETTLEESQAQGEVLGDSNSSCVTWKFYLPLFLLIIQVLLALSLEIANKEAGNKKVLFSLALSALMIAGFYLLRDASCYNQGDLMGTLSKWFIPVSVLMALFLRGVSSITIEEK